MVSFSSVILLASSVSSALAWSHLFERAPPGCLADNCLRAITGTEPGQKQTTANRVGDCSSYMVKTVTPDTVTVTATASFTSSTTTSLVTVTTTTTTGQFAKRSAITVIPSNVPAYASPCSGTVRYSSACSCAGITGSTITISAPTVTTTISATSTTTIDIVSTSTAVTIAPPAAPTACASSSVSFQYAEGSITFNEFFTGYGVTSNDAADATTFFDGALSACQAVLDCSSWAFNNNMDRRIDLHWLLNTNQWYCGTYSSFTWEYQTTYTGFNTSDSTVGVAMGYQWDDNSSAFD